MINVNDVIYDVVLWFQCDNWRTGVGTRTVHTYRGFKRMGYNPVVLKISDEVKNLMPIPYDTGYEDIDSYLISDHMAEIACQQAPGIITAMHYQKYTEKIFSLLLDGCAFVFGTMTTTKFHKDMINLMKECRTQVIAVRPGIEEFLIKEKGLDKKNVHMIRHIHCPPEDYAKTYISKMAKREKHAVSYSRIAPWKNVDIIAKANNILLMYDLEKCVEIFGSYEKDYMERHFNDKIPGWYDYENFTGPMYPKENQNFFGTDFALELAKTYRFVVDLTHFPGDHGGVQNTFLEAMCGQAVLIVNDKWIKIGNNPLKHNHNCIGIIGPAELSYVLDEYPHEQLQEISKNAYVEVYEKHVPQVIIPQYVKILEEISNGKR